MLTSTWPLFHIVDDASRRNLLRARGPGGDLPEMPQGEAVRAWDWERPAAIDKIMRQEPVSAVRRTA